MWFSFGCLIKWTEITRGAGSAVNVLVHGGKIVNGLFLYSASLSPRTPKALCNTAKTML